ncbi:MAG: glycosyltransferase family 4 protein [Gemmatimonadota bacterium]|nr:glycosyltransferase family 4 protein [Gemmatimonadota bacterium]
MRIAYVCADRGVPIFGTKGCSVHVQESIRALVGAGAEITVFAACRGGEPAADLRDLPVVPLPRRAAADGRAKEREALAANSRLIHLLERHGPFDAVYERYSLWSHAGMDHAWYHRIPGLLEVNAPLIEEQRKYRGLHDRQTAEWVARSAFARATDVVAVSHPVAQHVESFGPRPGHIHVIANGVDADRFRPGLPAAIPAGAGELTVGFVGTLKPWHGLPDLVDAFARFHERVPATRLLIVGDGPEYERLEARIAQYGILGASVLTGPVPHNVVPALLASMDVAVAPYPVLEQDYFSPLKLYEYMAASLPVVASRSGQVGEVVRHGVNGLLYEPGNVPALVDALLAIQGTPGLAARLGRAARESVLRDHTWSAVAQKILALIAARSNRRILARIAV